MAQSKQEIRQLLEQAGTEPRHRFGQNFMIDQNLVRIVADAGDISPDDLVIEVGPGTGTLTEELLSRAGAVVAVEIDRDLADLLRERFAHQSKFTLIEGDALSGKHAINPELAGLISDSIHRAQRVKLVANLPYNIASPLVIDLLISGVDLLAFTVQKEVADRLRAAAGLDDYGPLSAMAQLLSEVEVLRTLPPQAFWPMPRIDSALVRLRRRDELGADARGFSAFVHALFSFRRKTLRRGLIQMDLDAKRLLAATGLNGTVRPEQIDPRQLLSLYQVTRPRDGGTPDQPPP